MTKGITIPNARINYENIGQTEKQFCILYGARSEWSNTTKAVYDVLFNGIHRSVAKRNYDVKAQTIFAFLVRNKQKHEGMFELCDIQKKYELAGNKNPDLQE